MAKTLNPVEFKKSFNKVPRIALNLLLEKEKGEVLLTKRGIEPEIGKWHMPGSFLLKNETIASCLKRIAKKEIGINLYVQPRLVGLFENLDKDSRGHIIDAVYKAKISNSDIPTSTSESRQINFFKHLPYDIGFNHRQTLVKIGYKE